VRPIGSPPANSTRPSFNVTAPDNSSRIIPAALNVSLAGS
jgi:hypothetical protein